MPDWKILENGVTETTRTDDANRFVPVRIIRFKVGTHGPFQVTLDAKDFTAAKVTELLDKEAREIMALGGGSP